MDRFHSRWDGFIYIMMGGFLAVWFEFASRSPLNKKGVLLGHNFNLTVYVGGILAAFLLYLASQLFLPRHPDKGNSTPGFFDGFLYVIYGAAAIAALFLIYRIYAMECTLFPGTAAPTFLRQEVPHRVYAGAVLLIFAGLYCTVPRSMPRGIRTNRSFRIICALITAFVNAAALYAPNFYLDQGGGFHHMHSVLNSIVNVAHFVPYDRLNCCIYGHYSLICLPFVKLLGNDMFAVMQTLALMGFITFLAASYVASKLVKSNIVYLLVLFGMTGTTSIFTRHGQYFQINPLRLLFPSLVLAFFAWEAGMDESDRKRLVIRICLEYLLGSLSVVWNFETGLFCTASIAAVRIYRTWNENPVFSKKTVRTFIRALLYGILSLCAAFGLVALYNLVCGGRVNTVREFIYPLYSGTYNVNHLRKVLPGIQYLYFAQILLFLIGAVRALRRQSLRKTSGSAGSSYAESVRRDQLIFGTGVLGLAVLVYFMNRTAYSNISISHIPMMLLLGAFGEHSAALTRKDLNKNLQQPSLFGAASMSVVLLFGCFWLALEGALYIPFAYDYRATSTWATASYVDAVEGFRNTIPKDTYGFGTFVPELYYQLGWDTGCYMTDWSDINDYNREYALQHAFEKEAFITTESIEAPGYEIQTTIHMGTVDYQYYVRK